MLALPIMATSQKRKFKNMRSKTVWNYLGLQSLAGKDNIKFIFYPNYCLWSVQILLICTWSNMAWPIMVAFSLNNEKNIGTWSVAFETLFVEVLPRHRCTYLECLDLAVGSSDLTLFYKPFQTHEWLSNKILNSNKKIWLSNFVLVTLKNPPVSCWCLWKLN